MTKDIRVKLGEINLATEVLKIGLKATLGFLIFFLQDSAMSGVHYMRQIVSVSIA